MMCTLRMLDLKRIQAQKEVVSHTTGLYPTDGGATPKPREGKIA